MADQLLDQVRDALEGQIVRGPPNTLPSTNKITQDFEGQRLVEMLANVMLGAVGVRSTAPLSIA
jgi:signal peptidase complex subunit 1